MPDFVKIVSLPAMKVVSFHAMGDYLGHPEEKAHSKMMSWAKPKGLLNNPAEHQVFGFNNPDPPINEDGVPEPNKPYGYEFWISVDEDFEAENDLDVKNVEGGLYAVMTCRVENPAEIGRTWGKLVQWIKQSESFTFHPDWKGLQARYDEKHFKHGITGLENHLSGIIDEVPKGKPWKTKEKIILDIYAPVVEKKT